jgi:hypothetical protein
VASNRTIRIDIYSRGARAPKNSSDRGQRHGKTYYPISAFIRVVVAAFQCAQVEVREGGCDMRIQIEGGGIELRLGEKTGNILLSARVGLGSRG